MSFDPYAICPCGSGKKIKWCCAKAWPQLVRALEIIDSEHPEKAHEYLDQNPPVGATPGFVECIRGLAYSAAHKFKEAIAVFSEVIGDHPNYALPKELLGDVNMLVQQPVDAADWFLDAIDQYPGDASMRKAACWFKIARCHFTLHKPFAGWAALQRAHKIEPANEDVNTALEQFRTDPTLPNAYRLGMKLRSPDELAVFNEERREKWDRALAAAPEAKLETLVEAFEFLAEDDVYDVAAWYNLMLGKAWMGDNAGALEALDKYVAVETDAEAAIGAAEFGEHLRLARDLVGQCDHEFHMVAYQINDPEDFGKRIEKCANLAVFLTGEDQQRSVHWLNRPRATAAELATPIIGEKCRDLAQLMLAPGVVSIRAHNGEDLGAVIAEFEAVVGASARQVQTGQLPSSIEYVDFKPRTYLAEEGESQADFAKRTANATRDYFEGEWLTKPLRSLGNIAPVDAMQGQAERKKLEATIRFRERVHGLFDVAYSFDRLRSKLGLQGARPTVLGGEVPRDISTFSVAQLMELKPAELSDDDLLAAYRAANALDAPRTAMHFAEQIVKRDALADKVDVLGIFRRMIVEKLEHGQKLAAAQLVEAAGDYDKRTNGGKAVGEIDSLAARVHLADGKLDQAYEAYKRIFDREPDKLDLVAGGVERLLGVGAYKQALEFAKVGLERAQAKRNRDLQDQFREYIRAAGAKAESFVDSNKSAADEGT